MTSKNPEVNIQMTYGKIECLWLFHFWRKLIDLSEIQNWRDFLDIPWQSRLVKNSSKMSTAKCNCKAVHKSHFFFLRIPKFPELFKLFVCISMCTCSRLTVMALPVQFDFWERWSEATFLRHTFNNKIKKFDK